MPEYTFELETDICPNCEKDLDNVTCEKLDLVTDDYSYVQFENGPRFMAQEEHAVFYCAHCDESLEDITIAHPCVKED